MEDQLRSKIREYVFSELSEYFKLDENSPSGLVRIRSKWNNPIASQNVGVRGFETNGDPNGWSLRFKNTEYKVHRIIWTLVYGEIDSSLVVDHLDGNPFNNSISNLKVKTQKNNSRNQRLHSNSTTGHSGVHLMNDPKGYQYYVARWNELDGYRKSKCFSVLELGDAVAKALAIEYRKKQIQRLMEEGADYTERHGT